MIKKKVDKNVKSKNNENKDSYENELKFVPENEVEIVERKSKFLSKIYIVESIEDVNEILAKNKKEHYNAKHICYAYIIYDAKNKEFLAKAFDDGEPSKTAGSPMLSVLEKQGVINVLAVCIRYFGGILLGTGLLARTYKQCVVEVLKNVETINVEKGYIVTFKLEYNMADEIIYFCKINNINNISIEYLEKINCKVGVNEEKYNKLKDKFKQSNLEFDSIRQNLI